MPQKSIKQGNKDEKKEFFKEVEIKLVRIQHHIILGESWI